MVMKMRGGGRGYLSSGGAVVVLCILALSCCDAGKTPWPKLPKGQYEIKEGTLLSQDWSVATVQFDIDKDALSFPVVVPCFQCISEENYVKADDGLPCVCDYASKSNCGSAPKGCPKDTCDPDLVKERCTFNKNPLLQQWTEIPISLDDSEGDRIVHNISMQSGEKKYFRFTPRDPCRGYKIKAMLEVGLVDFLISYNYYQPTEIEQSWSTASITYPDHIEVDFCPEFDSFHLATVFITAIARSEVEFDLHLFHQQSTILEAELGATNEVCSDSPEHICIQEGLPYSVTNTDSNTVFAFFRYDFSATKDECKTLTVYAHTESGDCGLGGDFVTTTPNYFYGPLPTYQSEYPGSDIIHIQVCFEEEGTHSFYIGLYQWSQGTFTVTVAENKKPFLFSTSDISQYQYSFSATKALKATCPGQADPLDWYCNDWRNYCRQFWLVYPAEDPQPFWPTPNLWRVSSSPISAAIFSSLLHYDNPLENTKPGSLAVVMVLSVNMFGKKTTYLTEEELSQCTFESLNSVHVKKGYTIQGTAPIVKKNSKCRTEDFNALVETSSKYLDSLQKAVDFSELLQLVFEINALTFSSPWITCSDSANNLIETEKEYQLTSSSDCFVSDPTSKAYLEDPCCNSNLLWKYCCLPRTVNISSEVMIAPNSKSIDSQCEYSECTNAYVSDYLTMESNSFQCSTFSSSEYPTLVASSMGFYVACKSQYNIDAIALGQVDCSSDTECAFGGFSSKCNFVTGKCIPSRALELATVNCIIDGFDIYTEFYMKEALSLPGRKGSSGYINGFVDNFTRKECRNNYGHQSSLQRSENFMVIDKKCSIPRGCESTSWNPCLDSSCSIEPTNCITFCQMSWAEFDASKELCDSTYKCNWKGEECSESTKGKCEKECKKPSESFCAYCYDEAHCIEMPQLDSKEQCESTEACILPDGTLELMSKEECLQAKACTEPCHDGMTCVSSNNADRMCYSDDSESECAGIWRADIGTCTFPLLGESLCEQSGHTFFTCSSLSLDECSSCFDRSGSCSINQTMFGCRVAPINECSSKSDCLEDGGTCDDSSYYQQSGRETDDFGACIVPFQQQDFSGELPLCQQANTEGSPQGCMLTIYTNKTYCLSGAYENSIWHELASTKDECVSPKGCQSFSQIKAYSRLSEEDCTACGSNVVNFYKWRAGKWVTAVPTKFQWQEREVLPLYQWAPTIDFEKMQEVFLESIQATIFSDLRSQAFCDIHVKSQILNSITCACDGGKNCFDDLSVLKSGSGRPCIGLASTIQNPSATIAISETAVSQHAKLRCTEVTIETISIYQMEQPEQAPFSPLSKVRQFDSFNVVINDDNAIVGRVMSNGVKVTIDGELASMEVCLQKSYEAGSPPSKFTQWDLAIPDSSDSSFLNALGLHLLYNTTTDSDSNRYCFNVENPKSKQTYYLVIRDKTYKTDDGSLYGSETIAWWIFAALYTVLASLCLLTYILHYFGYPLHYYFLGLFLFASFMCTIRAIYFFLLAARVFDNGSALAVAYFLIEFPTLLYFTAFSCLGAFWLFLLYAHFQSKAQRYILSSVVLFNVLLYILFVVLLILFQTLPSTTDSECPGRIPAQNDNSRQQTISIFYQSFMAGVSVILAIWVTITGLRLLFGLKKRQFEGKIAMVTFLCALGLLLHCGFILYLSIAYSYDFTIIVLMMVLSELVPLFIIVIQFSVIRRKKHMQKYSKKAHFLRTLFFGRSSSTSSTSMSTNKKTYTSTKKTETVHSSSAS